MIKFIGFLVGIMTFLTSTAFANNCGYIQDNDLKHYCFAIQENSVNECYYISDNDLKHSCMAEVNKDSRECNYISDNDKRYICEVRSK